MLRIARFSAALVLAAVPAVPALGDEAANIALWEAHVASVVAKDIDAVVSRFAPDAIVIRRDAVLRGHEEIRAFFTAYVKAITDELMATFTLDGITAEGEMVNYQYHVTIGGVAVHTFDSVHIEDGLINYIGSAEFAVQ